MTAARDFAAAVLAADRGTLERGEVPDALAAAARRFAARAAAGERWPRGMTATLRAYAAAAKAHHAAHGAAPTIAQLAAAVGRSRTAAHAAAVRLRRLGAWPGSATSDKTPHHDAAGAV